MTEAIENVSGKLHHKGDLIVTGDILEGADLKVEDGRLIVKGDVHDGATVQQNDTRNDLFLRSNAFSVNGNTTYINMSRHFVNGVDVTDQVNQKSKKKGKTKLPHFKSGIEIRGKVGNDVKIYSNKSINLYQGIGHNGTIEAKGSLNAATIGNRTQANVSGSINTANISSEATIHAKGNINTSNIDNGATLHARGNINANVIRNNATLDARGSINAASAQGEAKLHAGGSITLGKASNSAILDAGGSITIIKHITPSGQIRDGKLTAIDLSSLVRTDGFRW